ncbi:MAG: sigma-70 family RNA polymerase sigma factor [Planctomycetota bacterium]
MAKDPIESSYLRPAPEVLLVHADFIGKLARSLVSDPHWAEDIAQETMVTALEAPPRRLDNVRGWLAVVARNLGRQLRRGEAHRVQRERTAAQVPAVPSAAEIAEREAVRREVVQAVLELAEPYQSAILLRYYEDCAPREIARRLGLPVETVRTRLKRALGKLAKALDARHGGNRREWMLGLSPWALVKTGGAAGVLAAVTSAPVLVKVAAAIVLVAGATFVVRNLSRPAMPEPPRTPIARLEEPAATPAIASLPSAPEPEEALVRETVPKPLDPPAIRGLVVNAADNSPVAADLFLIGVKTESYPLQTESFEDWARSFFVHSWKADASGHFELEGIPSGFFQLGARERSRGLVFRGAALVVGASLQAQATALAAASAEAGERPAPFYGLTEQDIVEISVPLVSGGILQGTVTSSSGDLLSKAELTVIPVTSVQAPAGEIDKLLRMLDPVLDRVVADERGFYRVEGCAGSCCVLVRAPRHCQALTPLQVEAGQTLTHDFVLAPAIRGVVVDLQEKAIAGAELFLTSDEDAGMSPRPLVKIANDLRRFEYPSAKSAEDGSFFFERVVPSQAGKDEATPPAEPKWCVLGTAEGYVPCWSEPIADARKGAELRLQMRDHTRLKGRVTEAGMSRALEGAIVRLLVAPEVYGAFLVEEAETDSEGQFLLTTVPLGESTLQVDLRGYERHSARLEVESRADVPDVEIALERREWVIRGHLLDLNGRPVPRFLYPFRERYPLAGGFYFGIVALSGDPHHLVREGESLMASWDLREAAASAEYTEADGSFSIPIPQRWTCETVWVALESCGNFSEMREVTAHGGEVEFRIDVEGIQRQFSILEVRALDPQGRPLSDFSHQLFVPGRSDEFFGQPFVFDLPESEIWLFNKPGTYDVRISAPGHGPVLLPDLHVRPGQILEPLEAQLVGEGTIHGRITPANVEGGSASLQVFDQRGNRLRYESIASDGRFEINGLGEGSVTVRASHRVAGVASRLVSLRPGAEVDVELTLRKESTVHITVLEPFVSNAGVVRIFDAKDRLVEQITGSFYGYVFHGPLEPGEYRVLVVSLGFPPIEKRFEVKPGETTELTLSSEVGDEAH